MAPFTSYESVRPWAKAIRQAVTLHQMPPWPPDPARSMKLGNDPTLSAREIATIQAWVDAGAPQGQSVASVDLNAAASQWQGPDGRPPDLVISMPKAAQIPASGDLPYVRFLAKVPLASDQWIMACQARPGNASVVHHMAVTEVEIPPGVSPADINGMEQLARMMGGATSVVQPLIASSSKPNLIDMLAIYTPGIGLETYPANTGKLLKGGENRYLNFNIHYTSNGKATSDRSEVAFWFRNGPAERQILRSSMSADTIIANGKELLPETPGERAEGTRVAIPPIPPGAANYELIAVTGFPQPVTIYQLHPHAHYRGKDFRYAVVYPDGREQTLLTIPKYDFRWQMAYDLATPLEIPAGSKLVVTAHYDNSTGNRSNPAPDQAVYFHAQNMSTDEMFSPFMQFSEETRAAKVATVETAGCLVLGNQPNHWSLSHIATPPSGTDTSKPIPLLGLAPFDPYQLRRDKVIVRGLLTHGKLNVVSLHPLAGTCP